MPLKVRPVDLADFNLLESYTEENGGTLTNPLLSDAWPVSAREDAERRNKWSIAQDRGRFQYDTTARYAKVIDTDLEPSEQIISIARWHEYENGYPLANNWMEVDIFAPSPHQPTFPDGLNGEDVVAFINEASRMRRNWELTANRCWILTTLVTRRKHRCRGAGGLLVRWGADQASAAGYVACLEAEPSAKSIYEKHGFVECGTLTFGSEDGGDELIQMCKLPPEKNESASKVE